MELIIVAVFLFGIFVGVLFTKIRSSGTLQIETSDPDGPYLFLELTTDVRTLMRKKSANFSVKVTNISQE